MPGKLNAQHKQTVKAIKAHKDIIVNNIRNPIVGARTVSQINRRFGKRKTQFSNRVQPVDQEELVDNLSAATAAAAQEIDCFCSRAKGPPTASSVCAQRQTFFFLELTKSNIRFPFVQFLFASRDKHFPWLGKIGRCLALCSGILVNLGKCVWRCAQTESLGFGWAFRSKAKAINLLAERSSSSVFDRLFEPCNKS